jgi:hypothetical protein
MKRQLKPTKKKDEDAREERMAQAQTANKKN